MVKNNKTIAAISTTLLLLLVAVAAYATINNWYSLLYSEEMDEQRIYLSTENIEIMIIQSESTKKYIYIKNNQYDYFLIDELEINDNNCILPDANVLSGKKINKIEIECPSFENMNDVVIYTKNGIVQGKVKLK